MNQTGSIVHVPEPAPELDAAAQEAARELQAVLTKPAGSLGRLEPLSVWLAGVRGVCPPGPAERVRVVIFAADHGVADAGVSAYPREVTAQMVANFLAGGAAVNVLAAQVGCHRAGGRPGRRDGRCGRARRDHPAQDQTRQRADRPRGRPDRRRDGTGAGGGPGDRRRGDRRAVPTCWWSETWASATRRRRPCSPPC